MIIFEKCATCLFKYVQDLKIEYFMQLNRIFYAVELFSPSFNITEGISCNDCANFDTFMKLGMVEDNHLRIGKSMGDTFENQ